ncbi:hypothetical protein ABIF66_008852 [Bradyrhizobium japonicum]|uniref:hypothetical protein n=1 Tax=Bradyrhizobium liaoningense TaxID=43992 RepID=UPI001BAB3208|nr:hypothetical protein [Bradyrhizobium liaoningense]MBR1070232.1 hypothetical protein [Bradyrhizobium liaoningense]
MMAAPLDPPLDPWAPGVRAADVPITAHRSGSDPLFPERDADNIVHLDAVDVLDITELTPADDRFVGKRIRRDGTVLQYPQVKLWRQAVAKIPATIPALFAYLSEARERNICLIRGQPAAPERKRTRRQIASEERGDHGFLDTPTCLHFFDIDGAAGHWRDDPEAAVKRIVGDMGEPWSSASYVWLLSASHGLRMETVEIGDDKVKCWTGEIDDDKIRVRLAFILDRAISWREASMLTDIVAAISGLPLDDSITRTVQPNYITRPRWDGHPGEDVLGNIPTIGMVGGGTETVDVVFTAATAPQTKTTTPRVKVPKDLEHRARWAAAQGHGIVVADHPDAITAVLAIGSDGRVRQHMMAAVVHVLKANPAPEHVSAIDHGLALADALQAILESHRGPIMAQLESHGRSWADVDSYLAGMADWGRWLIEHPSALKRRTVKLEQAPVEETSAEPGAQEIFDRVARTFEQFHLDTSQESARLLIAPTGSRKSTLMRSTAVKLAAEIGPDQSIVILVSRHQLGSEQIEALHREHPDAHFTAAIWRGRHAVDDDFIGPQKPGHKRLMCWRSREAKAVEGALLNVEHSLCKQGRGSNAVKCPFHDRCGVQRQKQMRATIWIAAHELLAHKPPKAFGTVVRLMIDENVTDALTFGVDEIADKDNYKIDIEQLLEKPNWYSYFSFSADNLMDARTELHQTVEGLHSDVGAMPDNRHIGVPVMSHDVLLFSDKHRAMLTQAGNKTFCTAELIRSEWRDKVEPPISPHMAPSQVEQELTAAADNRNVKKLVTLWKLVGELADTNCTGRVQIYRHARGEARFIRMCGLREIAEGWQCPVLICDATGDPELLRPIWPQLTCEVADWQQLPRPASVEISQIVDKSISKWAVAVEGTGKERIRRERAARRLYAAVLAKALSYGGADVGLITYKSTEAWIRANCHVPGWLKIHHFGAVEGTNDLQHVRALIVAGRPLASPEAVSRMAEALTGKYLEERDYLTVPKGGKIAVVANMAKTTAVLVDVWKHPDAFAERLRRQITEGQLIQATGRARAGLRGPESPLELCLWTDVAVPELGPVELVLWADVEVGLDAVMLAVGGVWLENVSHAAKAYAGLFTAKGLESARNRAKFASARSHCIPNKKERELPIRKTGTPLEVAYQLRGPGQRAVSAKTLLGLNATKAWLAERLGPLARFEAVELEGRAAAAE